MSNTAVYSPDEILQLLPYMTEEERQEAEFLLSQWKFPIWTPNPDLPDGSPNPQRMAVESTADILGYGGSAGGGKTDLLLGLAATQHTHSAIFRRVFPNLRGVIERSREVFNPDWQPHGQDSYNESLHRWVLDGGKRLLEFEACQYEKDKEKQRGRPRDFYGFDEATEFSRSQIEFITAWNRSTIPGQRCRVVLTFNPPADESGAWIIDFFAPWLKEEHPNPASPGELRWYATVDGKEVECENGRPFVHNGELIQPRSRTFIPARLEHNIHLANTNYRSILQSLPEPFRSQLLFGDFKANMEADPFQVIPTEWVKLAQKRWLERERPKKARPGVGVDVAWGGRDRTTIAKKYDTWFDEPKIYPGAATPKGKDVAVLVVSNLEGENPLYINMDALSGGKAAYEPTAECFDCVNPINAGAGSEYRDKSGRYKMRNMRAEYHWKMREALDPDSGYNVALPPGSEVLADLCAARFMLTTAGIQVESKDDIKERIGRSPDVGEAIMLANLIVTDNTQEASVWSWGNQR